MSPEILSHVARNFIECLNLKKSNVLIKSKGRNSHNVDSWNWSFISLSFDIRDSNPKIEHEKKNNISYSMVLTVVVLCGSILFRTKVHITTIGTLENAAILNTACAQESSHGCQARLWRCGKFRHALIQTYLLLATKPNYTRGRVGCPSDTRPLKTNSNANLR